MSRSVSPFDQGHRDHSLEEQQHDNTDTRHSTKDQSNPKEESDEHIQKETLNRGLQAPESDLAETTTRGIIERLSTTLLKLKKFITKHKTTRRTYYTAFILGLITVAYYIYSLFLQRRGNSIAIKDSWISEKNKNITLANAAAGFLMDCQKILLSGLDAGPDCKRFESAKLKAPEGIEDYLIYPNNTVTNISRRAFIASLAPSFSKRDQSNITHWNPLAYGLMGMAGAALAVLVFLLYRNVERRIQARVISARLFSLLLIVAPLMLALVGLAAGGASLFAAAQLWSRKSLAHGDLGQSGELKGWIAAKSFLEACQEAKDSNQTISDDCRKYMSKPLAPPPVKSVTNLDDATKYLDGARESIDLWPGMSKFEILSFAISLPTILYIIWQTLRYLVARRHIERSLLPPFGGSVQQDEDFELV